ncbi:hypothetical protein ACQKQD_16170 [Methylobacterium sp. NPDC080182]|uniref:hypothetical protein n=1 Tax=Methylobacterium sp. NPDC080182 TaxID=3390590 RepID=UPI003D028DBA
MPLDYSLVKLSDETCRAIPGGHALTATAYVARVSGDRLEHYVAVAGATESYVGWGTEDYQAAHLRLRRRLRDRLSELATVAAREAD